MLVFARIRTSVDPSINVLATIMIVATSILDTLAAQRVTVRH
jgi:ABC-type spermidine/putrescine transport system permease subunit II